jgi:2-polyprenyl-6-hydroxyphenyl methylase/3-demethylubiquinone-9 3-methyltransferase
MDSKDYYEHYWKRDDDVSDHDVTTPIRKQRLLASLTKYGVKAGSRVLDYGCGAGPFTNFLATSGYSAEGADISERALGYARSRFPNRTFIGLDPRGSLPVQDATYDAVWSTEVIEHLLDVGAALRELNRVTKPGGILILTTPYHGFWKNLLIIAVGFSRHFDPEGPHIRFFDKTGLAAVLQNAGFQGLEFGGIGRIWPIHRCWWVVARKVCSPRQDSTSKR